MATKICPACQTAHLSNHFSRHLRSDLHLTVERRVKEVEQKYADMEAVNAGYEKKIHELQIELKVMVERAERSEVIVEKAALKATTVHNVKQTKTTNNLAYISTEPINFKTFPKELPKLVTIEALLSNDRTFNGMISDALLQDGKGQNKVLCTDMARKQFQYKDELSGELVSDPYLERLRDRLKAGVNYRQIYTELLEHLDSMGGDISDNPSQAAMIMKRAKFEGTFINHMAKKTYKGATIKFEDS